MTQPEKPGGGVTRRAVLAGLAATATAATGPRPRPTAAPEGFHAILARSRLGALTAFAVADATTGAVIEGHQADLVRPPASVAKIVTALYALDRLGPGHRFATRLARVGPVEAGALRGDLALVGGGDPLFDTDALGDLLAEARATGLAAVEGRLLVATGALPELPEIDAGQPLGAAYNPAISGMNLNFNRVLFDWAPGEAGPQLRMTAPGLRFDAPTPTITAEATADGPPFHRVAGGREAWGFPAASLRGKGSLWLPVRTPAIYAGETLRALAAQDGLTLAAPQLAAADPGGVALAARASQPLAPMMRDLLRYSTNLTAEAVGLGASRAAGAPSGSLATSAAAMTDWARARYGLRRASLVNHSGLTGASAIPPAEMVRLLTAAAGRDGLPALLPERPVKGAAGGTLAAPGVRVIAKTGTLNFVSALAGYIEGPGARRRAFAIFAADPEARARIAPHERADPPGAGVWARRARAQEHALLRRWIAMDAA